MILDVFYILEDLLFKNKYKETLRFLCIYLLQPALVDGYKVALNCQAYLGNNPSPRERHNFPVRHSLGDGRNDGGRLRIIKKG
jgi:hypothetical protein